MKFSGYKCDFCSISAESSGVNLPSGWVKVNIVNGHDRFDGEGGKDFCGDKCAMNFFRERIAASKPEKKEKFTEAQKTYIKAALMAQGIEGRNMGSRFANHSKYHGDSLDPDCIVCAATTEADFPKV